MNKLKKILSQVLGVDESEINDQSSPDNIESWDSFNGLMLVSELESQYKIHFSTDEVISIRTVGDIKKALKKHGAKLD
jgi:acyl carrier protein